MTLRIGWFSSGREEADINLFQAVMSASEKGFMDATVSFVFCDYDEEESASDPDAPNRKRFMDLVRRYDIPLLNISWQKTRASWSHDPKTDWRTCFGKRMRKMIYERAFELGFVTGLSTPMDSDSCTRFDLVGLYPSLPDGPRGDRSKIVNQLIREHADQHGAMIRLCRPGGPEGVPISFCSFSLSSSELRPFWVDLERRAVGGKLALLADADIEASPLPKRISFEEERRELPLVTYTIKLFADGDLDIVNGKLLREGMAMTNATDLSPSVDAWLQQRSP